LLVYERFLSAFSPVSEGSAEPSAVEAVGNAPGLAELLELAAGLAFGGGVVRVHSRDEADQVRLLAADAFPEFADVIIPIAEDWLGRQFCIDAKRTTGPRKRLLLLEPGSGEAFDIDCGIPELFDIEFVNDPDTYLALDLFREWTAAGGAVPQKGQCVGFKVPLFLGGSGSVANLELSDRDVYWSLMGQLRAQTRDLPNGTQIGGIEIQRPPTE
jgi:hypothetical protein